MFARKVVTPADRRRLRELNKITKEKKKAWKELKKAKAPQEEIQRAWDEYNVASKEALQQLVDMH